ncbi:MAG: ABC transporter ATP-binding protein [Treponema sp.]|jgi:osmoprotectant transport system ATP-binding protein|nr:ABC transporter ATP-binding protein [Treponema sp.]
MGQNIIEIRRITKKFANARQYAVDDVSLNIPKGAFITIMGSSGSGKTTLLKMVNRIYEPTRGEIFFEGQNIAGLKVEEYRKKIGYVIQQIGLFPHMQVFENISVVPKSLKWDKSRIEERVNYLLELVRLQPHIYRNRYPSQLSGGQQQRVGLARAMAAEPSIMLMDEPFGAIDLITRQSLQEELLEIHKKLEKTILFVTHDIHEAFKLGEQVIIMHEGKVQQFDTPYNILFRPANDYVKKLIATESIFEKLRVLRVGSIMTPIQSVPQNAVPGAREDEPLSSVFGKFIESENRSLYVENSDGRIVGQIYWDSFQSIPTFKNGKIEYYV